MLAEFFLHKSPRARAYAWSGLLLIAAHGLLKAYIKYRINEWYGHFYTAGGNAATVSSDDALGLANGERRVYALLLEFALLCLPSVLVHPVYRFLVSTWLLQWRMALIRAYLREWKPNQVHVENGAQRVHEDTQRFAKGLQTCCSVLLDSVLTLCVFSPLLVRLGTAVQPTPLPSAWLLLCCVCIAAAGVAGSVMIGWTLIALEVQNQRVEADLRKALVLREERQDADADADAAADGSASRFTPVLHALRDNYSRLYRAFAVFSLWLGTYEQSVTMLPYVIAAPLLYASDPRARISLGTVTQVANAFGQVFASLNILTSNWTEVTDWLSVLRRLREWERHLRASPIGSDSLMQLQAVASDDQAEVV